MSTTTVRLPIADGATASVTIAAAARLDAATVPPKTRRAYAAAHVVADPRTACRGAATPIDWEATLQLRHRLWRLGLGVAESMDTAQRGMGLDAPQPWS